MSVLLALSSSLMWGTADFLGGTLSRRLAALVVVAVSQLFALVAFFAAALMFGDVSRISEVMLPAAGAGVSGALALLAFYSALASGTMGVVAPLAALGVLVPVVVGVAMGERPDALQLLGAVVAIVGGVLSSGPELRAGLPRRPIVLALLAGLGFGLTLVFLGQGGEIDPLLTLLGMRLVSVPLLWLVLASAVVMGSMKPLVRRTDLAPLAGVGLLDGSANLAYSAAVGAGGLLSLMSVLGSLYPAVTVVLARVVHREQMTRTQDIGIALALVGVLLVAAG